MSSQTHHLSQNSSNPSVQRLSHSGIFMPETDSVNVHLKDYEWQKDNRYSSNSKGPFIVCIIDSDPENNLGNYYIVEIGIELFDAGFKVTSLKKDNVKRVHDLRLIFDCEWICN